MEAGVCLEGVMRGRINNSMLKIVSLDIEILRTAQKIKEGWS